jgi:hypothetical protein
MSLNSPGGRWLVSWRENKKGTSYESKRIYELQKGESFEYESVKFISSIQKFVIRIFASFVIRSPVNNLFH